MDRKGTSSSSSSLSSSAQQPQQSSSKHKLNVKLVPVPSSVSAAVSGSAAAASDGNPPSTASNGVSVSHPDQITKSKEAKRERGPLLGFRVMSSSSSSSKDKSSATDGGEVRPRLLAVLPPSASLREPRFSALKGSPRSRSAAFFKRQRSGNDIDAAAPIAMAERNAAGAASANALADTDARAHPVDTSTKRTLLPPRQVPLKQRSVSFAPPTTVLCTDNVAGGVGVGPESEDSASDAVTNSGLSSPATSSTDGTDSTGGSGSISSRRRRNKKNSFSLRKGLKLQIVNPETLSPPRGGHGFGPPSTTAAEPADDTTEDLDPAAVAYVILQTSIFPSPHDPSCLAKTHCSSRPSVSTYLARFLSQSTLFFVFFFFLSCISITCVTPPRCRSFEARLRSNSKPFPMPGAGKISGSSNQPNPQNVQAGLALAIAMAQSGRGSGVSPLTVIPEAAGNGKSTGKSPLTVTGTLSSLKLAYECHAHWHRHISSFIFVSSFNSPSSRS